MPEIDYIICHELGHLKELYNDPEGYGRIIAEGDRADGLGQVYFRLYNCLMDIYVNTNTAQRFPLYRGSEPNAFAPIVNELYAQKLFPDKNLQSNPLSIQFSDYLLLLAMGVADQYQVSPEATEALSTPFTDHSGQNYSTQELVDTFLRPIPGHVLTLNKRSFEISSLEKKSKSTEIRCPICNDSAVPPAK